jgi:CheY-like chemotaxis protein
MIMKRSENKVPITILICDDDERARMVTERALYDARVSNVLRFVEDGEQLFDYLHQRRAFSGETGMAPRPGLILLDLQVPREDWRGSLEGMEIDRTLADIPVVFLSKSSLNDDAVRDCQLGATTFMTKPVTLSGLATAMDALGRHWFEIVELLPASARGTLRGD